MLAALVLLAAVAAEVPDHREPIVDCSAVGTLRRWVPVKNHRRALAFIDDVRNAVELSEGVPFDCGLELIARCGPDLDGDGVPESIVRVSWEERQVEGDDSETAAAARCHARVFRGSRASYSSLFIVLSRQTTPGRDFIEVLADETGSGREAPTNIDFTSWKGRPALKLHLEFMYSDSGEIEKREQIVIVEAGKLRVVQEKRLGRQR